MDKRLLSFDRFKDHCNNIFNNKYDYSKSEYLGMKHPIKIICKKISRPSKNKICTAEIF